MTSAAAVITGVGCLTARAVGRGALVSLAPPPQDRAPRDARLREPLPQPTTFVGKRPRLGRMDRFSRIAFLAAHEALVDAALDTHPVAPERLGVSLGTAYGCHEVNEAFYRGLLSEGPRGASPRLFAATLPSAPVGEIAIHCAAQGPSLTLAHGWDAGLAAVTAAARTCSCGRADAVLAGGADTITDTLLAFLATWGYDLDVAEGACFVVVERAAAARARGAPPLAQVRGVGAAFSPTPAQGPATRRAGEAALHDAALPAARLAAVVAAPAPGDLTDEAGWLPLAPLDLTASLGCHLGAAGAVAVAAACLAPSGPTLVLASDPLGSATALVLDTPDA